MNHSSMFGGIIIISLLGVSLGSFLNVCAYRIPRGLSVVSLPSFCPSCRRKLRWYELIPILSFIAIGGKCRTCLTGISFRYPLTEGVVALLAVVLFFFYSASSDFVYTVTFIMLMLLIAIIDWQDLIIPNIVVLVGLVIGLLLNVAFFRGEVFARLLSSVLALCSMLALRLLGNWLFKKETMGMGDVKLAALVGLYLGFQDFLIALWLAAIVGSMYGVVFNSAIRNPKSEMMQALDSCRKFPFGSFLALCSSLVLVFQKEINLLVESWLIL